MYCQTCGKQIGTGVCPTCPQRQVQQPNIQVVNMNANAPKCTYYGCQMMAVNRCDHQDCCTPCPHMLCINHTRRINAGSHYGMENRCPDHYNECVIL